MDLGRRVPRTAGMILIASLVVALVLGSGPAVPLYAQAPLKVARCLKPPSRSPG